MTFNEALTGHSRNVVFEFEIENGLFQKGRLGLKEKSFDATR